MTFRKFFIPSLVSLFLVSLLSFPSLAGHWVTGESGDQVHYFDDRGIRTGTWVYSSQKWYPYDPYTKTWGPSCPPPFEVPVRNFGVDRGDIRSDEEKFSIDGKEVSKKEALKALKSDGKGDLFPDDSNLPWLVWVGDPVVGAQIEKDLASDPNLSKMPVRFQSYQKGEFGACDRDGKVCYSPGLTAVLPNRVSVWHLNSYPGPAELVGYVRKLDPSYNPDTVPDPNDAVDGGYTVPLASLGLVSLLGSLLFFRTKPQ